MKKKMINTMFFVFVTLSMLTSCGGGSGGEDTSSDNSSTTPPPTTSSTASVVSGTMTKGSIIVNGITFTLAAGATIKIDDKPHPESNLANGMQVQVRGRVNDDGVTGSAENIEAQDEIQGTVSAINTTADPDTLTIAGQTIIVDSSVIFSNDGGLGIAAIIDDITEVEVHGQRDEFRNIIATRIEIKDELSANEIEIKGVIANISPSTFTINGQSVNYVLATIVPITSILFNGNLVEVKGVINRNVIIASRVELEDKEDAIFRPAENERFEVEGFISSFTNHPGTFKVGNTSVVTKITTQFKDGSSADLGNGVAVEAEGVMSKGVFDAQDIKFKKKIIRIITDDLTINLPGKEITMMGKTVKLNDMTINTDVTDATTRIQMRGYIDASGNIIARKINDAGTSNGNKDILQAGVTAEDTTGSTLTMLGIIADLSGLVTFKNDDNGVDITRAAFFEAVTPASTGGTVVKVRGTFDTVTSTISAEEAEIED